MSRIAAALYWDPNTSRDSKLSASSPVPQAYPEESFADLDISGGEISDEISIEDIQQSNEGIEVELAVGTNMTEQSRMSEEETEMRRTAQELFELEELLLDQHITNIKVSRCMLILLLFLKLVNSPVGNICRRMLKC